MSRVQGYNPALFSGTTTSSTTAFLGANSSPKYEFFPQADNTNTISASPNMEQPKLTLTNPIKEWYNNTFVRPKQDEALKLWNNAANNVSPEVRRSTEERTIAFMNMSDGDRNILEALG